MRGGTKGVSENSNEALVKIVGIAMDDKAEKQTFIQFLNGKQQKKSVFKNAGKHRGLQTSGKVQETVAVVTPLFLHLIPLLKNVNSK